MGVQNEDFYVEIVITQVLSASVSFLASTIIAAFVVSSGGLITPYRRLIFCLSISDMFQSSALILGPWFSEFSYRSSYGIGNKYTCGCDAFLFIMGSSAWPLYTFCFCIYYLCKLRRRMTDNEFAQMVEKKMHAGIIMLSSAISILALSIGSVHSVGTMCYVKSNTYLVLLVNSLGIPLFSLAGIIVCIFLIFRHAFMTQNMRGSTHRPSLRSRTREHSSRRQSMRHPGGRVLKRRAGTLALSSLSSEANINKGILDRDRPSQARKIPLDKEGSLDRTEKAEDESPILRETHSQPKGPKEEDEAHRLIRTGVTSEARMEFCSDGHDVELQPLDAAQTTEELRNIVRSRREPPRTANHSQIVHNRIRSLDSRKNYAQSLRINVINGDQEAIERLYKRQLISQACYYVMLFLVTIVPFLIVSITQLGGSRPSSWMIRLNAFFFPLGGLFHILIYTGPNVSSLRRTYPQCSRLQAFFILLRAGGEVPDNVDAFSSCCGCYCFTPLMSNNMDVGNPPLANIDAFLESSISLPENSDEGVDGSRSSSEHFSAEDWSFEMGKKSKMSVIIEESSGDIHCSSGMSQSC